VNGLVVLDRRHLPERLPELVPSASRLSAVLTSTGRTWLYIDMGHVGVRQARWEFARLVPGLGRDLAGLDATDPLLPDIVEDVQAAVSSGVGAVLSLVRTVAALEKPEHFHLHDGHPLAPGLADHFGFLLRLPIPFPHSGRASLDPLFGVSGLQSIRLHGILAARPRPCLVHTGDPRARRAPAGTGLPR
jgi:hypothetical protein